MNPSPNSEYQTELTDYILDLQAFVEEKIAEAENDPASRCAALSEAAGALPIMKDRLLRGDQGLLSQFMLVGLFDEDFEGMPSCYPAHSWKRPTLSGNASRH